MTAPLKVTCAGCDVTEWLPGHVELPAETEPQRLRRHGWRDGRCPTCVFLHHPDPPTSRAGLGFSGRRTPPTGAQTAWLLAQLDRRMRVAPFTAVHHGACLGADALFHREVRSAFPNVTIHVHPPTTGTYIDARSIEDADVLHPPRPYLERNHHIVDASGHLIALPDGPERLRSGTWATVRYARRVDVGRTVWPSDEDPGPPTSPAASVWDRPEGMRI